MKNYQVNFQDVVIVERPVVVKPDVLSKKELAKRENGSIPSKMD